MVWNNLFAALFDVTLTNVPYMARLSLTANIFVAKYNISTLFNNGIDYILDITVLSADNIKDKILSKGISCFVSSHFL